MRKQIFIKPGDKFGRLTAVEYSHTGKHYRRYFVFKCDCGGKITISAEAASSGNTKSCGCLRRDTTIKRYGLFPGQAAMRQLIIQSYKRPNGKEWNLTEKQFYEISQKKCFYCGSEPFRMKKSQNNTGNFIYNGLDRMDSSKGYYLENVVPCCRICNLAKSDLSIDVFRSWAIRIGQKAMAKQWGSPVRVDERDCDTCQNDGECYSTVLRCKGYKKREGMDV